MAASYVLAPEGLGPLAEEPHGFLDGVPETLVSASAPVPGLCVVLVLTDKAPKLYAALNGVRTVVRESFDLPPPARAVQ